MEVELGWLAEVVQRHAPVFRLHPDDHFMPSSVEWFMERSSLCLTTAVGRAGLEEGWKTLVARGEVRAPALLQHQARYPQHSLVLRLDPGARRGPPKEELDEQPVYAHVKAVHCAERAEPEALEINYLTFYPHNGPYRVGGVLLTGAHDGDWEHLTARVDPVSGALQGVWYNAHRSRDGCWVPGSQVPRTPGGRPIAYVAKHGHGTYPQPGRYLRHFFLGNDLLSGEGPTWRPRRVVLVPGSPPGEEGPHLGGSGSAFIESAAQPAELPGAEATVVQQQVSIASCAGGAAVVTTAAGSMAAVTSQQRRQLMGVPSRGTRLHPHQQQQHHAHFQQQGTLPEDEAVEVVVDDPCHWAWFRGVWGETDAPVAQPWWHTAETPVTRSAMLRLFGHFVRETYSV